MDDSLVIWQLSDGKRGHQRQVEGLIAALAARVNVVAYPIEVPARPAQRLAGYLRGLLPGTASLPAPALIIGAGRACQWPLLAARRQRGGRAIYLMRPVLPTSWFDLCIIPRHDRPTVRANVVISDGPLCPMQPQVVGQQTQLGLILVGGPSAHYAWDTDSVLAQIENIIAATSGLEWIVSDSRRSPPPFATAARSRAGFRFVAHQDTEADWLPGMLGRARQVWVTEDSVSMIYEALSAGAEVGLIDVPAKRRDRINAIADDLHARGWISRISDLPGTSPRRAPVVLREAERCAALILARWPALVTGAGS